MEGVMQFRKLPEGCVSTILSFTSPQDACKSSLVSTIFESAAESGIVWERFLPVDYQDIVSKSRVCFKFSSKKELFLHLCNSLLIDGELQDREIIRQEILYTICNDPLYWHWDSLPESRFFEVAVLRTMSWLEIVGKIKKKMLFPNTKYGAYLILKTTERSYGLDSLPSEISVEVGNNQGSTTTAYLRLAREYARKQQMERLFYGNRMEMLKSSVVEGDGRAPSERDGGWLEIELGELSSGENDEQVKMSLMSSLERWSYHLRD
ncbi:hypothetical protein SADUNF_Sadunf05G0011800 [Salix dunnii]|uniref:F-box domain-containing protein n=1 Tax=Salix dunnii TaxID=1413687 RepID=A0A835K902_9ROSI|nr:hypothetical protein SADUNF_Sadunf05G0011800 [Salix dunnii]